MLTGSCVVKPLDIRVIEKPDGWRGAGWGAMFFLG